MYKILGHEYKIIHSSDCHLVGHGAGSANYEKLEITISNIVPKSRQEEALLHETIELISIHLNLAIDHMRLTTLCEVLYQVLKDNNMFCNLDKILK